MYCVLTEQGTEKMILESFAVLHGVFSFYIRDGILQKIEISPPEINQGRKQELKKNADEKVNMFLYSSYKAFIGILLQHLSDTSADVQVKSLEILIDIFETKCKINFS